MIQRKIDRVVATHLHRGFLGEGHMAAAVIDGNDFARTDPFIILMDDQLDLPGGEPVGGPHPHAGFETVTLVLQGDDTHFKTGSLELMTAGKGIIHTEEITSKTTMHILQLWLALPPDKRWVEPSWQKILPEDVPTYRAGGIEAKVYSGSSHGLTSSLRNYTPFTLVDFKMNEQSQTTQHVPASYNGFIYVVKGAIYLGDTKVGEGEAGWFNKPGTIGDTEVLFRTGDHGAHFVLYAGQPHNVPIVSHGPFIGDSRDDIMRLFAEYRAGKMPHLDNLDASRKIVHKRVGVN